MIERIIGWILMIPALILVLVSAAGAFIILGAFATLIGVVVWAMFSVAFG